MFTRLVYVSLWFRFGFISLWLRFDLVWFGFCFVLLWFRFVFVSFRCVFVSFWFRFAKYSKPDFTSSTVLPFSSFSCSISLFNSSTPATTVCKASLCRRVFSKLSLKATLPLFFLCLVQATVALR